MKYKHLKSVAHNLGHSFLSDMNAVSLDGRYTVVPELLFQAARAAQEPRVTVDFLRQIVEPEALRFPALLKAVQGYGSALPRLLQSQNVDPTAVREARLALEFDFAGTHPSKYHPHEDVPTFACVVELTDDRGVVHRGTPTNWWRD
jgi:hypothetical protein